MSATIVTHKVTKDRKVAPRFSTFPCPICEHEFTTVVKTAEARRRRRCLGCEQEFTTYEVHYPNEHGGDRKSPAFTERKKQMEMPS
jgi:transcription elongation factor Elf1